MVLGKPTFSNFSFTRANFFVKIGAFRYLSREVSTSKTV